MIEKVRLIHVNKIKREKARKTEQKMQEIYDLKNKLYQIQLEEANKKKELRQSKNKQFERMKNTIEENQKQKKLIQEI